MRPNIQVLGGKTGYNDDARYCLVIATKIDGHTYYMSFLSNEGKLTRFGDVARVADWIVLRRKAVPGGVPVPAKPTTTLVSTHVPARPRAAARLAASSRPPSRRSRTSRRPRPDRHAAPEPALAAPAARRHRGTGRSDDAPARLAGSGDRCAADRCGGAHAPVGPRPRYTDLGRPSGHPANSASSLAGVREQVRGGLRWVA